MRIAFALVILVTVLLASIAPTARAQAEEKGDPSKQEVPLPASGGWHGRLVYDNDVGVWTIGTLKCFNSYGCPEIFGLDDLGRCTILSSYSGKWTPFQTTHDGAWLGALVTADLDPSLPGEEIYTGGKNGNLYQIQARKYGGFDVRVVAHLGDEEIHTLIAGDLLPQREGQELLAFTRRGEVVDVRWHEGKRDFDTLKIDQLPGRIRQAIALPSNTGERHWIAAVGRYGEVLLLRMKPNGMDQRTILREPMGFGRLALKPRGEGDPLVIYVTRDDGVVLRLERIKGEKWRREAIYAGPQGPRGIAAGRFNSDASVETLAVFGYSKKVQLLSRRPKEPWKVETIFTDIGKGHWLSAVEIDGRNDTHELIGSGYGKRIFLLSRPPGYGLAGVLVNPDAPEEPAPSSKEDKAPTKSEINTVDLSIALPARRGADEQLTPLRYGGGFEAKTMMFQTLVRRDAKGFIVPDLAASYCHTHGGRSWVFKLDPKARFHDGSQVTASAVRLHFIRWVGLPEHAWLPASELIHKVVADDPETLRIELKQPHALLPDLCAINPCAIAAPAMHDHQGEFTQPIGSGPFSWGGTRDKNWLLLQHGKETVAVRRYYDDSDIKPLDLFMNHEIDILWDNWSYEIPRDGVAELRKQSAVSIKDSPGSSVCYLDFSFKGATSTLELRRRVQAAIRRNLLVNEVEFGLADPCDTWAAPSVSYWRSSDGQQAPTFQSEVGAEPLHILVNKTNPREVALGRALVRQLAQSEIPADLLVFQGQLYAETVSTQAFDLRVSRTWGVPYDPHLSLVARFLPQPQGTAVADRGGSSPAALVALVRRALGEPDESARVPIYARIQEMIDREALVIPLFAPRRIVMAHAGQGLPKVDIDLYRTDLRPCLGPHSVKQATR